MAKILNAGALFSAFDLHGLSLKNRVATTSPLTRSLEQASSGCQIR